MCAAYDIYDAGGTVTGSFAPSEMQANVGLGWRFMPWLSLGANARYLSSTLSEGHSYGAVSSDIFVMSRISDFSLALGVSSLGSRVESASGATYSLPASLTFGAGVELFGISLDLAYLIAAGDSPLRNTMTFGLGYSF